MTTLHLRCVKTLTITLSTANWHGDENSTQDKSTEASSSSDKSTCGTPVLVGWLIL